MYLELEEEEEEEEEKLLQMIDGRILQYNCSLILI
jgi:hypothetical protein